MQVQDMDSISRESGTLSHRTEIFRSKLIEDFQILESITEQGRKKAPIYNSVDITGEKLE